jgi:hypothetical protein
MGYSLDYEAKSDHLMSPCSAALRLTGFSLGLMSKDEQMVLAFAYGAHHALQADFSFAQEHYQRILELSEAYKLRMEATGAKLQEIAYHLDTSFQYA